MEKMRIEAPPADLKEWDRVVKGLEKPDGEVAVAMVGKYVNLTESYKSLTEALIHAGINTRTRVNIRYIDSEDIEKSGSDCLNGMDAILIPGGFGTRGTEGKIAAVRYAREENVPYLGICLGMQVAVIEFARNLAGLEGAHSTEFNADTTHPVIALISEWTAGDGTMEARDKDSDLGGTMRLGAQKCRLVPGSRSRGIYKRAVIAERHRHRYEFNNGYLNALQDAGLVIAGKSVDDNLVEVVELADHPWFVGCQFHPEFTSTPRDGHPLFSGFIRAARTRRGAQRG